jgi:hypothetical protein
VALELLYHQSLILEAVEEAVEDLRDAYTVSKMVLGQLQQQQTVAQAAIKERCRMARMALMASPS